jgi:hypothetical protein
MVPKRISDLGMLLHQFALRTLAWDTVVGEMMSW